jgi:hypothetical protein
VRPAGKQMVNGEEITQREVGEISAYEHTEGHERCRRVL